MAQARRRLAQDDRRHREVSLRSRHVSPDSRKLATTRGAGAASAPGRCPRPKSACVPRFAESHGIFRPAKGRGPKWPPLHWSSSTTHRSCRDAGGQAPPPVLACLQITSAVGRERRWKRRQRPRARRLDPRNSFATTGDFATTGEFRDAQWSGGRFGPGLAGGRTCSGRCPERPFTPAEREIKGSSDRPTVGGRSGPRSTETVDDNPDRAGDDGGQAPRLSHRTGEGSVISGLLEIARPREAEKDLNAVQSRFSNSRQSLSNDFERERQRARSIACASRG